MSWTEFIIKYVKPEWNYNRPYDDDSDYVFNKEYVNGNYKDYEEDNLYEKFIRERSKP